MKKTIYSIISVLLLLTLFVSCAQENEAVFLSIVHSNVQSKYGCISYVGEYENRIYIRTSKHGIISFKFDEKGKASDVKELDIHKEGSTIDYAYISGSTLYGLDNNGELFSYDFTDSKETKLSSLSFKYLANGYAVRSDSDANMYAISELSTSKASKINKLVSNEYFVNETTIYHDDAPIATYSNATVYDVIKVDSTYYVVVCESSSYNVYKVEDNTLKTKISTISDEPTASAYLCDNKIAYKTNSSIEIVDITKTNTAATAKTNGWASNLYTSTTDIFQFVTINDKLYSLNATGGMTYINLTKDEATAVFDI